MNRKTTVDPIPQQPYFLRALYEWCVDSRYTPYVTVKVTASSRVPQAYVKDGLIVLNIGPAAVRNLHMDNTWLSFSARFGGVSQIVEVPVADVQAIYAKESGEGMAFQATQSVDNSAMKPASTAGLQPPDPERPTGKGRPSLRVVK